MLGLILRVLLAILAFRIIGGAVRSLQRRGSGSRKAPDRQPEEGADRVRRSEYKDLTPYEIEDAEFEEFPRQEE